MRRDIVIKRVTTIEECKVCNQMFSELIMYETQFDKSIIPHVDINNYYERTLGRGDSTIFLANCGMDSVGYIMAYQHEPKVSVDGNFVTIMHLYIKPEYRGEGIGKLLIEKVEQWARQVFGQCTIELDCFVDNKTTIEFYSRLDFKPIRVKMRKNI